MPTLILLLVVGLLITYVSKFNSMPVAVNFGQYILNDVPLFYVIVGSLIVGLVLSYILFIFHRVSTSMKIRGKDNEIRKTKDEVLDLTKQVHQLELTNEKQKNSKRSEPVDQNAL